MSHTKDRLTASEHQGIVEVRFDSGRSCAIMACKTKDNEWADAQRLALCWNSHDALVEALQLVALACSNAASEERFGEAVTSIMPKIRAALELAKEQP